MTKNDCFKVMECVAKRKLEGVMAHDALMDAFDVMNIEKFAHLHKHRAKSEFEEFQKVKSYTILKYGCIPSTEGATIDDKSLLNFGQKYNRENLNSDAKKRIVAYLFEYIVEWESETIEFLSKKYCELYDGGNIADALFVSELISDTNKELEGFIRTEIKYKDLNYDMIELLDE